MEYNLGVQIRMNKLFKHDKVFIVAADHRTTIGPQKGLDISSISHMVADKQLDGLIIRPSMAKFLANVPLKDVTLMMYLTGKLDRGVDHVQFNTVEYAVSCGADVVCSEFKFGSSGDLKNTYECSRISESAHKLGIPHLITTYVRPEQLATMGPVAYAHACTIAEELGADIIKIGLPDDDEVVQECIASVNTPIVIAGGSKEPIDTLCQKVSNFTNKGGAGIVLGRNAWGADDREMVIDRMKNILYGI